jgi:TRAP-type C4-dicarboxylate transport system permease small subunit
MTNLVQRLRSAVEWLAMAMLFTMFAITLAGVIGRYALNAPIAWADELGMILLLWAVFLTDAFVTRDRDHIAFDMVWERAPAAGRRWLLLFQAGAFGLLFAAALPTVVDYVQFLWRERTSALEWRLDFVFSCFAVYLAVVVVRLAAKFARAAGPRWRDEVSDTDPAQTANILG